MYKITIFNLIDTFRYGNILEKFLKLRHKGFIQEQRYCVLDYDGLEFDQYDNPFARYIVICNDDNNAIACARLNRTDIPYMAKDLWRNYIPNHCLPERSDTYELTRLYVDTDVQKLERMHLSRIIVGIVYQYCLANHIKAFCFVTNESLLNIAKRLKMQVSDLTTFHIDGYPNSKYAMVHVLSENSQYIDILKQTTGYDILKTISC